MKFRSLLCVALCATSLLAVGCGSEDDTFVNTQAIQNAQNQQNAGGQTANGSTFNVTFNNTGSNAFLNAMVSGDQADVAGFNVNTAQTRTFQLTEGLTTPVVGTRSLTVSIRDTNNIEVGEQFTFSTDDNPAVGAFAAYAEQFALPAQVNSRWVSTGGTATVTAISANSVSVQLNNVTFAPAADGNVNGTGTFTISGTATVNQ